MAAGRRRLRGRAPSSSVARPGPAAASALLDACTLEHVLEHSHFASTRAYRCHASPWVAGAESAVSSSPRAVIPSLGKMRYRWVLIVRCET